jgi:hypothetical protein
MNGVELGEIDMYSRLMDRETNVLQELNAASGACSMKESLDETFFSMTLHEFVMDYVRSMSVMLYPNNKKWSERNKDVFYIGITIILFAVVIMIGECSGR